MVQAGCPGVQDMASGPSVSAGFSQSLEWGTGWRSEPPRTTAILSALAPPGGVVAGPTCICVLVPSVWLPHSCLHCISHRWTAFTKLRAADTYVRSVSSVTFLTLPPGCLLFSGSHGAARSPPGQMPPSGPSLGTGLGPHRESLLQKIPVFLSCPFSHLCSESGGCVFALERSGAHGSASVMSPVLLSAPAGRCLAQAPSPTERPKAQGHLSPAAVGQPRVRGPS